MLPTEIYIYIFSYLGITPTNRCRAITQQGIMCKNKIKKNTPQIELFCKNHIKKLLRKNSVCLFDDFFEICFLLQSTIKNKEKYTKSLTNDENKKHKIPYLISHSSYGSYPVYTNYVISNIQHSNQ